MPVITISRGSLSGGEQLARRLQARLDYEMLSREVLIEAAGKYGVDEQTLASGLEEPAGLWQRLTHEKDRYILAVQSTLAEHIANGNVIYHGHAGQFLLRDLPGVIKVRLIAPTDYRIRAAIAEHGMSREEAKAHIEHIDEKRSRWVRQIYSADWTDPELYDLVLNLAHIDVETAAALVADMAHSREFRSSGAREREIKDFALGARVTAALVFDANLALTAAEVTVRGGVVTLGETSEVVHRRDELIALVRSIPGVTRVIAAGAEAPGGAGLAPQHKRVADVMLPISGYPHVHEHHTIFEALGAIGGSSVALKDGYLVQPRYVLVLDRNNVLVGVLSRRDLLRGLGMTHQQRSIDRARGTIERMAPFNDIGQEIADWVSLFSATAVGNAQEPIRAVMSPIRGAVGLDDDLNHVVGCMQKAGIDLVPVLDQGRAVGVILMTDIFDLVAEFITENSQT